MDEPKLKNGARKWGYLQNKIELKEFDQQCQTYFIEIKQITFFLLEWISFLPFALLLLAIDYLLILICFFSLKRDYFTILDYVFYLDGLAAYFTIFDVFLGTCSRLNNKRDLLPTIGAVKVTF